MKALTEFFTPKLIKGIDAKTALAAEGKTPEEIEQSIGESFKLEGDKLKYFCNCMNIAAENSEKLSRIRVIKFSEGEVIPKGAIQVEDDHYIPEFQKAPQGVKAASKDGGQNKGQGKGKKNDGPRSSPWGISPEEMAAKKASAKNAQKTKK